MKVSHALVGGALALCATAAAAQASADAARGRELYESRCIACHSIDASRVGPAHREVVGRRAGSVADYDYSPIPKGPFPARR